MSWFDRLLVWWQNAAKNFFAGPVPENDLIPMDIELTEVEARINSGAPPRYPTDFRGLLSPMEAEARKYWPLGGPIKSYRQLLEGCANCASRVNSGRVAGSVIPWSEYRLGDGRVPTYEDCRHFIRAIEDKVAEARTDTVRAWQTTKIRESLKYVRGKSGYPLRVYQHVGFVSGLAVWVPDFWMLDPQLTLIHWHTNPDALLREVVMRFVGGSVMELGGKLIPLQVDDALVDSLSMAASRRLNVYANLAFFETINDWVIALHWPEIRQEFLAAGF